MVPSRSIKIATEVDAAAVADDDASLNEILVDAVGIGDSRQEEVGVGGKDFLANGQECHRFEQGVPLFEYHGDVTLQQGGIAQNFHRLGLCEDVDVVGVLDFVVKPNDVFAGKCHAEADTSGCPRLGEGGEDNEIGVLGNVHAEGTLGGEIAVCLIDNDDALERLDDLFDFLPQEGVACGIVGRTDEDDFGVVVAGGKQGVGIHVEVGCEGHLAVLHIVDIGTDFVHAIGGVNRHDVVLAWTAEDAEREVNRLVAAIAQKDVANGHALHG